MENIINPNAKCFCVLSDERYLIFGLTFCESIHKYMSSDYVIHYLATDDATYKKLLYIAEAYQLNIYPHKLLEIEKTNAYKEIEKRYPRRGGKQDQDSPLHWGLTPLFSHYIMEKFNSPIMYADTDILFYRDPEEIFACCEDRSVGLVTHKNVSLNADPKTSPPYNVGILYFNNNENGKKTLEWWMDHIVHRKNLPDGRKGGGWLDQALLSFFPQICPQNEIKLIDESIGHGGPWGLNKAKIENGNYIWNSKGILHDKTTTQPLSFFHFSHFLPNYDNNSWDYDYFGELRLKKNIKEREDVKLLYQDYYNKCRQVKEVYEI